MPEDYPALCLPTSETCDKEISKTIGFYQTIFGRIIDKKITGENRVQKTILESMGTLEMAGKATSQGERTTQ